MSRNTVLVAEDEKVVSMHLQELLTNLGYEVVSIVSSGEDAIEQTAHHRPDVVLMDIRLDSEIDGIDAAAQIKARVGVPVVFMSAYADPETVERAVRTEPMGYLVKPVSESELRANIQLALYKHGSDRRTKVYQQKLTSTLGSITDAVIVVDSEESIEYMNDAARSMALLSQAESYLGKPFSVIFRIIDGDTGKPAEFPLLKAIEEKSTINRTTNSLIQGHSSDEIYVDYSASPIVDEDSSSSGAVVVLRDVSEYKEKEKRLIASAFYDTLTGLPNRELFIEHLNHSINLKKRQRDYLFSVMFIDLDGFKQMNDSFGHVAGDLVLITVALKLKTAVRPNDIVARLGGDEFVVLLDDIKGEDDPAIVAKRILQGFESPFCIKGKTAGISASIGIEMGDTEDKSADTFVRNADVAMYHVKNRGKSGFQYYQGSGLPAEESVGS